MKKKLIFFIAAFLVILGIYYYEQSTGKIKVQEALNFSKVKPNTLQIITNDSEIKVIKEAVEKAIKVDGFVDMAEPQYKIKIGNEKYFLWLDPQRDTGTIMSVKDNHTIYRIPSGKKIIEILE